MNNIKKLSALAVVLVLVSGCASNGDRHQLSRNGCIIAGSLIGGAGGLAVDDEAEAFALGAVLGGAIAYAFCDEDADSDGDGVVDSKDRCSGTPSGVAVNAVGCPLDNDRDGVPDSKDQCPNTPAGAEVDESGCKIEKMVDGDRDGDGVKDSMDQCADTPAGKAVNDIGCHTILSLEGVSFQLNSAELGQDAKAELDRVVELMNADATVSLRVEGHTDSSGAESYNQRLSQGRAESVVDYLVSRGIARDRLTPVGYGEARPVAANDTPEGRARNRRVDLVAGN